MEIKKLIATGIIFLFIDVAVAPSINSGVVKASYDNDLVEVTSQACGIQGFGNTTVKLTKQQYHNLEQYLVEFRARLNQTRTREEVVPIFKDAVVELNKYGLLPKGMSVEKAQRFVIGPYQNIKLINYLKKLSNKLENRFSRGGSIMCLIYGEAQNYTCFQGPILRFVYDGLYTMSEILYFIFEKYSNRVGLELMMLLFYFLYPIASSISLTMSEKILNSPLLGSFIYYGFESVWGTVGPYYFPAEGIVNTIGLFGTKNWNGPFFGTLPSLPLIYHDNTLYTEVHYPGVRGFTGLRLLSNTSNVYFGTALSVNLGPNYPENN